MNEETFYLLEKVMHRVDGPMGETAFWRSVPGGGDGYWVFWNDGQTHHTYHYPPDFLFKEYA